MNLLANPICNSLTLFTSSRANKYYHPPHLSSIFITNCSKRRCECYDLHDELVPYAKSWSWQKAIVKERKELIAKDEDFSDTVIILQHPPVYTLGTGSSEDFLRFNMKDAPLDIYRTERGGEVTYHGPGQLVMYPILNLSYHKRDLHWYLRALEEVVIRTLRSTFSIKATRNEGLTGVWVGNQKLAAIGVKVSQWVTYHGLALNVTTDLSPFNQIVPCGIKDRQVGTVKGLLSDPVMPMRCEEDISDYTDDSNLIDKAHKSLINEFSEVFQLWTSTEGGEVYVEGGPTMVGRDIAIREVENANPNSDASNMLSNGGANANEFLSLGTRGSKIEEHECRRCYTPPAKMASSSSTTSLDYHQPGEYRNGAGMYSISMENFLG